MRLDLKENISFPFTDPEWAMKLLKMTIAHLLIITGPAVAGYQLAVIREAANGEDDKLPEFSGSNFVDFWVKGFIFGLLAFALVMIPSFGIGALFVGGVMMLGDSGGAAAGIGILGMLAFFAIVMAIAFFVPALMLRYAMTGSAGSMFDMGAALSDIKQGPVDYLVIFFFPFLASVLVSMLAATGIGAILVPPLMVLIMIVQARMLGNYYRAYFH